MSYGNRPPHDAFYGILPHQISPAIQPNTVPVEGHDPTSDQYPRRLLPRWGRWAAIHSKSGPVFIHISEKAWKSRGKIRSRLAVQRVTVSRPDFGGGWCRNFEDLTVCGGEKDDISVQFFSNNFANLVKLEKLSRANFGRNFSHWFYWRQIF